MKTRTTGARLPRGNERTTERGRSITKSNIPLIASPSLSSSLARVGVVRQIHYGRACFREKRSRTHPPTYTQIHANSLRELNSLAEREIERKPSRVSAHRYTYTHTLTMGIGNVETAARGRVGSLRSQLCIYTARCCRCRQFAKSRVVFARGCQFFFDFPPLNSFPSTYICTRVGRSFIFFLSHSRQPFFRPRTSRRERAKKVYVRICESFGTCAGSRARR